ncbi:MAG: 30S ribosomal protein S18 [Patescibacteria group bacterium]|nr:30S ribosomal protein S18 [Patescibacteria group bacterium]
MSQNYNYNRRKSCFFCKKNIKEIDYRDAQALRRFLGVWSKIKSAKETGNCSRHQRLLTQAIKRARFLALLPYITR